MLRTLVRSDCVDNVNAASVLIEEHLTVGHCEECVVLTTTNTYTWMHFRAALADDDVTCDHCLTAEFLYAEALAA